MVSLICSMALPAMLSMLIAALYNIVDSIFVSRFSEDALTAVSLVFPFQQLIIAVGVGTAVGVNSLIARNLGAHRPDDASRAARHGLVLSVIDAVVFVGIGLCSPLVLQYFTTSPTVLADACTYSHIVVCFAGFNLYSIMCEKIMQSTGNMVIPMAQVMTGAIVNIILDPILIFGMFGLPAMGVQGAAIATIIGQICALCIGAYFIHMRQHDLDCNLRNFRMNLHTFGQIYEVGLPTIVMQSVASFMVSGMNIILMRYSETAIAVLGVYFKLQSFVFLPVYGINQGALPVVGYSYGAGNRKRMVEAFRVSVIGALLIMGLGVALFQCLPEVMMGWFTDASLWENGTPELVTIGAAALRGISLSFLGAGFCIICSMVFQATGHGLAALLTSIFRQIVVILPAAWLLGQLFGLDGIWYAFPIAEVLSLAMSLGFIVHLDRKEFRHLVPREN